MQKAIEERRQYYAAPFTKAEEAEIFKFFRFDYKQYSDDEIKKAAVTLGAVRGLPMPVVKLLNKISEKEKHGRT